MNILEPKPLTEEAFVEAYNVAVDAPYLPPVECVGPGDSRYLPELAKRGELPDRPYEFYFVDDVLVEVREAEDGRIINQYTTEEKAVAARKRLQEAAIAERVPEGARMNRKARRAYHARAMAHIRKRGREMYLKGKRKLRKMEGK